MKKEYKILLQGTVCTNVLEIRTTLVCSLSLSYLWLLTKQIIIPPPSQPNNYVKAISEALQALKQQLSHRSHVSWNANRMSIPYRFKHQTTEVKWFTQGSAKQLLPGQSSIVTISQEIHTSAYVVLGALPVEESSVPKFGRSMPSLF